MSRYRRILGEHSDRDEYGQRTAVLSTFLVLRPLRKESARASRDVPRSP